MAAPTTLLRPTLHIEVQLTGKHSPTAADRYCTEVTQYLHDNFVSLRVGQHITEIQESMFVRNSNACRR